MGDVRTEPIPSRQAELVVNPTVVLDLKLRWRRRGEPLEQLDPQDVEELQLARWVLDRAIERAQGLDRGRAAEGPLGDLAARRGLLLKPAEVPEDLSGFRCDLAREVCELLPERGAEWGRVGARVTSALRVNPRCFLQTEATPPDEVRAELPARQAGSRAPNTFDRFSRARPILWVDDPRAWCPTPLWLDRDPDADAIVGLTLGAVEVHELAPDLRNRLLLAGVLQAPGEVDLATAGARAEGLRESLRTNQFVIVRNAISPILAGALRRYYRTLRENGFFLLDTGQVPGGRDGVYCDAASRFIQHQLVRLVDSVTGERSMPSYTWVFRYREGAELERHTDRDQCRWNMSLCVDSEPERDRSEVWPIYVEADGRPQRCDLEIGDCLLYRGNEVPHWRDPLGGGAVTMALLHYVASDFDGDLT